MTGLVGSGPADAAPFLGRTILPIARYRFEFRMEAELRLPEFAGSLLRGQFGAELRRTACMTRLPACAPCPLFRTCPYPAIFETPAPESHPLQRFSQVPNPYVFEPPPFGTRRVSPDGLLRFDLVLVGRALEQLPLIAYSLQRAIGRGLGKARVRGVLEDLLLEQGPDAAGVWDPDAARILPHQAALRVPSVFPTGSVRLRFDTPLRLQHQGSPLDGETLRPRTLVTALMRRAALLFEFHAGLPGLAAQASAVARHAEGLTDARALRWQDWTRYSSRQKTEMTLGGVVGTWTLHGDLAPITPWLWLGQWLHAGKNATMGLGRYTLEPIESGGETARTPEGGRHAVTPET